LALDLTGGIWSKQCIASRSRAAIAQNSFYQMIS
jgi:hypothetical protein